MRRLSLLLVLAAACGSVKKHGGTDGGQGDGDGGVSCTPGEPLECDGDSIVVCGDDGMSQRTVACDISCDPDSLSCTCEPDTSVCEEGVESVCGSDGHATPHSCPLGCFDDTRCAQLDATNRLTQFLDDAASGPDLTLPDGTIINTDSQEIIVDGLPINVTPVLLEAPADPGGIKVLVFAVSSLTITGDIITQGQPALAFVSDGEIAIHGVVRSLAGAGSDGTGGGSVLVVCDPGPPATGHISGRGGGGFGGRGGDGGDIIGGPAGGAGGAIVGNEMIVPLRGGGQDPGFYGAGGGLQLVSLSRITISDGGAIHAGGVAGLDNGTGGGAGGGVVLEAPVIELSGAGSAIAANGGGGGCGNSGTVTASAEEGRLDDRRAAGCQSDGGGDGGKGGAGTTGNGLAGESLSGCGIVAGQGGGGVGRIRISDKDGSFAPAGGATVSPPAVVNTVGRR
jgi:hypothetical protein